MLIDIKTKKSYSDHNIDHNDRLKVGSCSFECIIMLLVSFSKLSKNVLQGNK